MNAKKRFSVLLIVLLTVLAGAMFAYRTLADRITPESTLLDGSTASESTEQTADTVKTGIDSNDHAPAADNADADIFAIDFTVYDIDGNPVSPSSFIGRPVLVNFWATWCPPCKSEMPDFDRVYADYGDDVVFMMINMTDGSRDTVKSASAFVEDKGYSFPVYYDSDLDAAYTWGVSSIPMTVLIGADGNIIGAQVGALNESQLRMILDSVLQPSNLTEQGENQ
ncbi:MAG: TlpA family protein disulfide reductase [Clostridia bacterium]|nr:TlpA family protein disulfide reductase [Clostridia bacterium]